MKQHLWITVLAGLRDFHRNNSLNMELRSELVQIQVLRLKGQTGAALLNAKRLLTKCERIEAFTIGYQALEQMEAIYISIGESSIEMDESWESLYQKKGLMLGQLATIDGMRTIERELIQLTIRHGITSRTTLDSKIDRQLLDIENQLKSMELADNSVFDAQFRYYQAQATIGRIRLDHNRELAGFTKVIGLLDANPLITSRFYRDFYAVALHNLINASLFARKLDSVPDLLDQLEKEASEPEHIRIRNFSFLTHDRLVYLRLSEHYQEGFNYWNLISESPILPQLNVDERASIEINGAVLSFWNGRISEALSITRKLTEPGAQHETLNASRLLNLLCNFELSDMDHLEHLTRSYNRIWLADSSANRLELLMIESFQKIISSRELKPDWATMSTKAQQISKLPSEQNKLFSFNLLRYLDQKQLLKT
ncbi:MAG: hypothetical protein JKX84_07775 [Flavobacteriales bacterium]|nr:hypothetical protein [Flavobacteriales bacterium]